MSEVQDLASALVWKVICAWKLITFLFHPLIPGLNLVLRFGLNLVTCLHFTNYLQDSMHTFYLFSRTSHAC